MGPDGLDMVDLLRRMTEQGASDLHLKIPSPPVLRVRGDLVALAGYAALTLHDMEVLLEQVTTPAQRQRGARERELDFAYSVSGLGRFRVNAFWQRGSVSLALRAVPIEVPVLSSLGLPDACQQLALRPRGLVLVTGPTGSGKSTTLAAMVDHINEHQRRHIVTIEDPIEFLHRDKRSLIAQREVGQDTLSFANALRHVLRQDPDVILLGELRDLESIATAITAAETGHLVLSTLHTTSAAQTVDRLIDVFPAGQQDQIRLQVSQVLEGVLTQELLPRADGRGRVAAVEVLLGTPAIRNQIREGKSFLIPSVLATNTALGMQTLDQALVALVNRGVVDHGEALSRARDPKEFLRLLEFTRSSL